MMTHIYPLNCTDYFNNRIFKNARRLTADILNKCSAVAEMGDRLATIDIGRKLGAVPPFWEGVLDPHLTLWPGPRPHACQVSS